jgi:LysR family hydrogen peroxide-inducible transcriptional activator
MDFHQLRYFVAVAEAGSISLAARRCHVAQPSLSAQIRRLEGSLGVALFDRHGKGASLTAAGRQLLPRARRLVAEMEAMATGFRQELKEGGGTLRVGAIPTMAPYLLPSAIRRLADEFPKASVKTVENYTEALVELLVENQLDAAVVSTPIRHELVETEIVGRERFVAAFADDHPLARAETVDLRQMEPDRLIVLSEMNCLGRQVAEYCASQSVRSEVACEAAHLVTVLELVRGHVGFSVVPESAARAGHVSGISYVPIEDETASRNIAVARRSGRARSVLDEAFASSVRESMA